MIRSASGLSWVAWRRCASAAHGQGDQALLSAVVEVALNTPAFGAARLDDAPAGLFDDC